MTKGFSYDNPAMALVVDCESRRVLDCNRVSSGYDINNLADAHDLTRVDIIVRAITKTAPAEVEAEIIEPTPVIDGILADDDIPF